MRPASSAPRSTWRCFAAACAHGETLEGLGGSWEATENLLTDGGMQWAYSELFQNYSGRQVADYLSSRTLFGLRPFRVSRFVSCPGRGGRCGSGIRRMPFG